MRRIEVTPEQQEAARIRYEEKGESFRQIAPSLTMGERTLRDRAREWGWRRPAGIRAAPAVDRLALAARVRGAVERELAAVERVIDRRTGRRLGESARTLATLVKTLAELRRLEAAAPAAGAAEEDDGAFGDLDALRRDLSRRLAALCAEGES